MKVKKKPLEWEISGDGYYPYCPVCMYEPREEVLFKHIELADLTLCPQCKARLSYPYRRKK